MFFEFLFFYVWFGDVGGLNCYFTIYQPTVVEFIDGRGLRVRTTAAAHWPVAGMPIPLTIESVLFVLEPQIAPPPERGKLLFKLKVEELSVKNVPGIVEDSMLPLINEGLAVLENAIGWDYAKTLDIHVKIPPKAAPLESFHLSAGKAQVAVTHEAIIVRLALEMHFETMGVKIVDAPTVGTPTSTTTAKPG